MELKEKLRKEIESTPNAKFLILSPSLWEELIASRRSFRNKKNPYMTFMGLYCAKDNRYGDYFLSEVEPKDFFTESGMMYLYHQVQWLKYNLKKPYRIKISTALANGFPIVPSHILEVEVEVMPPPFEGWGVEFSLTDIATKAQQSFNVKDEYRGLDNESIRRIIDQQTIPYSILCMNLQSDFNFSGIVRSANAFAAEDVYYYGDRRWDRRGSCGVQNYTKVLYLKEKEEILSLKETYRLIALENTGGTVPMESFNWFSSDRKPMIVVGEEGSGLSEEMLSLCDARVEIPMFGTVRSLNVGVAAAIAMNDLSTKYRKVKEC